MEGCVDDSSTYITIPVSQIQGVMDPMEDSSDIITTFDISPKV